MNTLASEIRKIELETLRHELETLCVCSVRYALGRQTYIVSDVCGIVHQHIKDLPKRTLCVIAGDIYSALDLDDAGADIDRANWMFLLDKLNEEIKTRKE